MDIQVHKANSYLIISTKEYLLQDILKLSKLKDKEGILKVARGKEFVAYNGTPIRVSIDFWAEPLQVNREWNDIFKVLKEKNRWTKILAIYIWKLFFRYKVEINTFLVHHHYTCLAINAEMSYSTWNEKMIISNMNA